MRWIWLTSLVAGLLLAPTAAAERVYRWIGDNGRIEYGKSIPTRMIPRGYEIVETRTGEVIKRVEPQLTDEQYEAELAYNACREALNKLKSRYHSVDDIERAEQVALNNIDTQLTNERANLASNQARLEEAQSQAASLERSGEALPKALVRALQTHSRQIETIEAAINARLAERDEARRLFAEDREQYTEGCSRPLIANHIPGD